MKLKQKIKDYLVLNGWDNKELPHQFHTDGYYIVESEKDSDGFPVYLIINKRFDETVFRGRILSVKHLCDLLMFVKEDYDLTLPEKNILWALLNT